jgi:hypothetical protein
MQLGKSSSRLGRESAKSKEQGSAGFIDGGRAVDISGTFVIEEE